jgi:hypothetical protein
MLAGVLTLDVVSFPFDATGLLVFAVGLSIAVAFGIRWLVRRGKKDE